MSKIPCILLLIASLFGQDGDGDFSLGEISFMIKDIHIGGAVQDRGRRSEFNNGSGALDIGLLKYSFSNIEVSGDVNANNERAKIKYKFSGPEFEMSNFKMDVSFDAPNIWLLLKEEMANEHTYGAENYFDEIKEAIGSYYKVYNQLPDNLNELQNMGLLSAPGDYQGWDFKYQPPGKIIAISNKDMPGGPRKKITHEYTGSNIKDYFSTNSYYYYSWQTTGYGQYDDNREPKLVKNKVSIVIGKVKQYFGASGSVDLNARNQVVDFQLQKAGFSVSKVNANFTVDRSSKTTFSIADFKTEAKNIAFEFDTYDEISLVEKASIEISLKNLEVNFPKNVQNDPEFKEIADYLNINSGKFRIRQIDLDLTFNRGRDLKLKGTVDTQFGKAVVDGSFSIRQPVRYDSDFTIDNFTVEISNLSNPILEFIDVWEEGTGNTLPRKGRSIYLEIYGDIDNPQIKGLEDLNF